MHTILAYTSPARGHLFPMMDLLVELEARGHQVIVQTLESEKDRVEEVGIEHLPIAGEIEAIELLDHAASNPIAQFQVALETWLERAPFEVADLQESVEATNPDFLLIDANTFGAAAVAESQDIPWALHMPYCLPTPSRDAPAFGPGFSPPRGAFGRMRDAFVRGLMNRALSAQTRALNRFRTKHGAKAVGAVHELYDRPPLIFYRTAEPFEYPRSDWGANVVPLGPGLWAPSDEAPEWLDELAHPRVLVTISTEAQKDGAIIETALDALEGHVGSVICTTSAEDPESFDAGSETTKICKFLPHAEVFPYVDCIVTHGGMGTVQRALAAGKPLCVVPWGRDQSESAQRVVVAGAGTRLNPSKLESGRLRRAVDEAMKSKAGAERIAQAFEQMGGASRAADLIEERFEKASPDSLRATG